ncbi:phosphotransferase [Halorubrum sp. JWXQ-INN 858]|uniref:phosphotransferase n=1 Tax=Halorubrum sp. JWXQ-INN 858 TaxID=2690782 RepID=UPI00135791A2|nr:phosphotransferase [Halorubrum sp. JWXQ-INN 858]MWV65463.1 phosphotransferase [Halorubrum sp. JWXQ-INN 858]
MSGPDTRRFVDEPSAVRDGVPSWTSVEREPRGIDAETLDALADELATRPMRAVLADAFPDGGRDERNALFVDPAGAWRIPVSSHLRGRCLDVNTGVGTRALLLAEVVDSVDAAGTSPEALRFLAARDDYACHDRVTPIHADLRTLPEPTEPYDVVVADLRGRHRPDSLGDAVDALAEPLAADGSLLLLIDGPTRSAGVTTAAGLGTPLDDSPSPVDATRQLLSGVIDPIDRDRFPSVDRYAMVPDAVDPSFVLRVGDTAATDRLIAAGEGGSLGDRLATRTASLAGRLGVLDRLWPGFLLACSRDGTPGGSEATGRARQNPDQDRHPVSEGLLTRGGGRSTVLVDDGAGGLDSVVKVPHRRAHAEFAFDEFRTTQALSGDDPGSTGVSGTIPSGTLSMTWFGPTYAERPAPGTPLSSFVSADPDRFRSVLELGIDWLIRLQRPRATSVAPRSPDAVRDELSLPEIGLGPPPVESPIRLFRAPCHGDFHPKNVFVDPAGGADGPVTAVIDWELGGLDDDPIADPAFFCLQTARLAFGGLEAGLEAAFTSPGPHADAVSDSISRYCAAMGIDRSTFLLYLPSVWIRRLRRCLERGATASYSGRGVRRAADVRLLWDRHDEIVATLGEPDAGGASSSQS